MSSQSLVLQLQSDAMDENTRVSALLRKAYVVARKLKVKELEDWAKLELDGYNDTPKADMPRYRIMRGQAMALNPVHGWVPILFENSTLMQELSEMQSNHAIGEIETLFENSESNGYFTVQYPAELSADLMKAMRVKMMPAFRCQRPSMKCVLDAVRNIILQWSLKLEEDGILGEGLSFSNQEIKTAEKAHYTVNVFKGDIVQSQFQQGATSSTQSRTSK